MSAARSMQSAPHILVPLPSTAAAARSAAMLDAISYVFKERELLNYVPYLLGITLLYTLRLWSAGYTCQEERNLHNKTFILVVSGLSYRPDSPDL